MAEYSKELRAAKEAADEAVKIIRQFQEKNNFEINFKGLNDLVTDADIAAEEKILDVISSYFPEDQVMAEESYEEKILPVERTWFIDPVDGTTNFAHNFPIFCVSIGLWENKQPKAALVIEVNSGEVFEAVEGEGALCNGRSISVSSVEEPSHALVGTGFPYNDMSLSTNYLHLFKWLLNHVQAIRRPGAASYDLCCVAAGRFDGFYEYALSPWDVGAAGLIVKEAGGIISDWEGGDNWLYGERLVAGNSDVHPFLLRAVQEHFPAEELSK
ncbi:MAG TPA: inositol monophosphatase family protein [Balneolaceae bacterium]|nr:inositol monophosphatase family protein [Balneolaceae bacterium]